MAVRRNRKTARKDRKSKKDRKNKNVTRKDRRNRNTRRNRKETAVTSLAVNGSHFVSRKRQSLR